MHKKGQLAELELLGAVPSKAVLFFTTALVLRVLPTLKQLSFSLVFASSKSKSSSFVRAEGQNNERDTIKEPIQK